MTQWRTYNYYKNANCPPVSALPWNGVTHILDVFWGVRPDGTLDPDMILSMSGHTTQLISEAHSRGVKVLLCIGGIDGGAIQSGTNLYNASVANPEQVATNIVNVCHQYGYDGVAMDWEPNISMDAQVFAVLTNLMRCLRVKLHSYYVPKLLTIAAAAHPIWAPLFAGSEVEYLCDRIHVMGFNLGGHSAGRSFFNAALYGGNAEDSANPAMSVDSTIQMYRTAGMAARKINLVMPFYGWRFYSSQGPFAVAANVGVPPDQADIDHVTLTNTLLPTATHTEFDGIARVPWAKLPDNSWVSHEIEQSIIEKVQYVYRHELGGFDVHHIGGTYFPNLTNKFPLWDAAISVPLPTTPHVVVDVDEACLTVLDGWNQVFTGMIYGASKPATIDAYVFDLDETNPRWMHPIVIQSDGSWSHNPPHDHNPFPLPPGEYWFYVMAPGNQILAKRKFRVLASVN